MKTKLGVICAVLLLNAGLYGSAGAAEEQAAPSEIDVTAFQALDVDGSGSVSIEEAKVNPDISDTFEDADLNKDGQLDMTEFSAMEVSDE